MKIKAQNLIEFVIVIPVLILIVFGIIEFAIFWRNVQTVQSIALESGTAASLQIVKGQYVSSNIGDNDCSDGDCFNPAVTKAIDVIKNRMSALNIKNINFTYEDLGSYYGSRPYSVYSIKSTETKITADGTFPLLELTVDYRDPYKNGIITQLNYQYTTILLGASIKLPGGNDIVIIPRDIPISSTKIQQYSNY